MINRLPQEEITLFPNSVNPTDAINYICSYIDTSACETLSVDISDMNIIDACYVSSTCSTRHFIKYPEGQIKWKTSSDKVREFNEKLDLGNTLYIL